jgi:adenosylcobinamide kinase/adenosylcobinamide-phosphate guanylyltransferase
MAEIILVTGGARSGKSKFAEKLALKIGNNHAAYIATAQIFDEEMEQRVKIHKSRRFNNWVNYEAPFDADKIISSVTEDVILFDCVTMYLTNWILTKNLDDKNIFTDFEILIEKLIAAAQNSCATVIFVSNEVGGGIVPENKLARIFRDFAGLANQKIALHSEKVFLTVAGLAVDIKNFADILTRTQEKT